MAKQVIRPKKPGKQSKKKQDFPKSPPEPKIPGDEAPPIEKKPAKAMSLQTFFVPAVFLLVYLVLWFAPSVNLDDPWNEGMSLVNASRSIKDPSEKQAILDKGGALLKELVRIHPYHARLQFFAAYYYDDAGDYDSAIAYAKEAIRIEGRATVNQVGPLAKNVIVDSALKKAKPLIARKDYAAARKILDEALAIQPASKPLLLLLGGVSMYEQSWDSARAFLEQAIKIDPNDDEIYYVLGTIAVSQKQIPVAIEYLEKSLAIKPGAPAAQTLLLRLKSLETDSQPKSAH